MPMNDTAEILSPETIQAYNDLPVGIIVFGEDGKIQYANLCSESVFGNIRGKMVSDIISNVAGFISLPESQYPVSFVAVCSDQFRNEVNINCRLKKTQSGGYILAVSDAEAHFEQISAIAAQKTAAENLLKSAVIGSGSLQDALHEICRIASEALGVYRVNIWEFAPEYVSINSLINYDRRVNELLPNATLFRYQLPAYFNLLETEEIIPTQDVGTNPNTAELLEGYIKPNGILSLIDVPVRISGKMVGLVCFEDTDTKREWSNAEQKFGLFVAQVIALTLETSRRKLAQQELEKTLDEKKLLLNEVHRRVRTNFALIQDLIRQDLSLAKDDHHKELFNELRNRIANLDMIQRQLYQSGSVGKVNFRDLILDLVAGYRAMHSGETVNIITTLDQCEISVNKASFAGLLLNELMMFLINNKSNGAGDKISVRMKIVNTRIELHIHSTCKTDQAEINSRIPTSYQMAEKLESVLKTDFANGFNASVSFEI
jgi:two-component sensor histidine kinase